MSSSPSQDTPSSNDRSARVDGSAEPGSVLVRLMEECLVKLEAGEVVDRDALVAANPELAEQLDACLASLRFIHRAVQPGEGLPARLGDFRIIREIGRGGMGVVYEAEQISLKRPVALKVLRFGAVADAEAMQRFQREAETIAALHHTNIVPVFAIGAEQSVHYYAMQLIEGRCLREIALDKSLAPVPDKTIAQWGLQAAEALAHAHQRNVVHRDIKPSNLILGTDGRIWLTDFGLAKRLDDVTLSLSGALLGTPRYMSPEQASAMRRPVDHRTDIYSLGATLYELVTGRPLFDSQSPHVVISQILSVEPMPPRAIVPHLPRDLETIILKCLSKDAGQRYQSAQDLADDLRAFGESRSIKARRATPVERAGRWVKRNRKQLITTIAAVAVTVVFSMGGSLWRGQVAAARNATLSLKTKTGPLTAEVLTAAGELVVPSFTVPNEQPVPVPEGEYRLRVAGKGALSKTAWITLTRGQTQQLEVELDHEELHPPLPLKSATGYEFIDFGDGPDLIALPESPNPNDQHVLRRISGKTGKEIWSLDVHQDSAGLKPLLSTDEVGSQWWMSTVFGWKSQQSSGLKALRPLLDLDDDNVPDLVWSHQDGRSVFAVSGKTGKPLWWHHFPTEKSPTAHRHFESAELMRVRQPDGTLLPVVVLTDVRVDQDDPKPSVASLSAISARDKSPLWSVEIGVGVSKLASARTALRAPLGRKFLAGGDGRLQTGSAVDRPSPPRRCPLGLYELRGFST